MSENRSFGSQAVRPKVGTSANSALIRYYLPRLKLSIGLFSCKRGNERLVLLHFELLAQIIAVIPGKFNVLEKWRMPAVWNAIFTAHTVKQ